jgi:hypothetical protein
LIGIDFEGSSTLAGVAVTITNNMISIVPAFANDQIIRGLNDDSFGGVFSAYFNTVLVGGTNTGLDDSWACSRETGANASSSHTLFDNICFNNRTGGGGQHFAVGDQSNGTGTYTSDYNIFVGIGTPTAANFFDKGTVATGTPVDFATWQGQPTPTRDVNSQASNPGGNYTVANMFVSDSDLHLRFGTNPAINTGIPAGGVTNDFDGQPRPFSSQVDIGADELVPTAAAVTLAGRVTTAEGNGIRNASVTISGGSLPGPVVAQTGTFGYFRFENLQSGLTYVVTVGSKRFVFTQPTRVITMVDDVGDFDFVAEP